MSIDWAVLWPYLGGVARWIALFVIAVGLSQNLLSLLQLGFAYHALRQRLV